MSNMGSVNKQETLAYPIHTRVAMKAIRVKKQQAQGIEENNPVRLYTQ